MNICIYTPQGHNTEKTGSLTVEEEPGWHKLLLYQVPENWIHRDRKPTTVGVNADTVGRQLERNVI